MCWLLALALLCATPGAAQTPEYPSKPIRFLVGVAPGGGTDFVARLIAVKLTEKFGQPVITDNRIGATGTIALEMTVKAPPDGYTFVVFNIGHLMSALLARTKRIDAVKDFAPVSQIATGTLMLGLNAGVPVKTLSDFIGYARSKPGQLAYGSGGLGSTQQLAMELLKHEARIDLIHIPYKGTGPIAVDLVSGQIQVAISNLLALYPHVKAGRLTALAVASKARIRVICRCPPRILRFRQRRPSNVRKRWRSKVRRWCQRAAARSTRPAAWRVSTPIPTHDKHQSMVCAVRSRTSRGMVSKSTTTSCAQTRSLA